MSTMPKYKPGKFLPTAERAIRNFIVAALQAGQGVLNNQSRADTGRKIGKVAYCGLLIVG